MESRLGILSSDSHLYKNQHIKGLELLSLMEDDFLGNKSPKRIITPEGRPEYADSEIDFNISHTENLIICTMAEGRTGCDIENSHRKVSAAVADKFFHPEELAFMASSPSEEEKRKRFLMLWVLKEAYIKLMGTSVAYLKGTPSFLIEENTIKTCRDNPLYYAFFEGSGYVMAAAFDSRYSRDSLKIKKYSTAPDFRLTALN